MAVFLVYMVVVPVGIRLGNLLMFRPVSAFLVIANVIFSQAVRLI